MISPKFLSRLVAAQIALAAASAAMAQDDVPSNPDKDVFFGTTHGHSNMSIDAFGLGNQNAGPEDAYRFARGEAVSHMGGDKVQLKQPLDFFMMTDHSEMMGTPPMLTQKGSPIYDSPVAKMVQEGKGSEAFGAIAQSIVAGKALPGFGSPELSASVWKQVQDNAEKYNDPGKFTTMIAYEWTSLPGNANMHRNVIFRDTIVPKVPFTAFDSDREVDLWSAMET